MKQTLNQDSGKSSETDQSSLEAQPMDSARSELITPNNEMIDEDDEKKTIPNPKLNKLTLEMFMNNNYYSKYVSKTDPDKFHKMEEFRKSISKYKNEILDFTYELMINLEKQKIVNHDLYTKFEDYMIACLKHLQMKEADAKAEAIANVQYDDEVADALSDPGDTNFMECPRTEWTAGGGDEVTRVSGRFSGSSESTGRETPNMFPRSFWGPTVKRNYK